MESGCWLFKLKKKIKIRDKQKIVSTYWTYSGMEIGLDLRYDNPDACPLPGMPFS
jgi:hypothetical protein